MATASLIVSAALAGCQNSTARRASLFGSNSGNTSEYTGSISKNGIIRATTKLAAKWRTNRDDAKTALQYAAHLNAIGSRERALSVLSHSVTKNPKNQAVVAAYGRQLGRAGRFRDANRMLQKAHGLGAPDWRIYSAQGTVFDRMGHFDRARKAYQYALRLAPNHAAIISNLGMSYALSGNLTTAEAELRKAFKLWPKNARIRQNLALIVGLQGRFKEAERIASADLPARVVKANMAYLRQMLTQPNSWKALADANKS